MSFGASPRDSSNIPISSVYVPNVGFIAVQGSASSNTDASSNTSTAVLLALGASNSTSGTLQNAQNTNGNGTALSVLGYASVVFTVNMAGFTGTVTFKASEDGTNYDPINVAQAGTGTISTTAVGSTTTSIHCYDASIAGYQFVEAVTSGVSAGNVTVTAHAIPINIAPRVVQVSGSITASNPSVGTDGSAIPTSSTLIGASDGTNLQQLLVESASNRNLRTALYNGANELAIDSSGRITLVPNQGVEIVDSGGTNKLAIDSSGRLTLVPNQVVEIGDGTTPTQKLAIDASGRLTILSIANALPAGSNLIGTVELADSGGTNKLAIDASGRLTLIPNSSMNMAQIAATTTSVNSGTSDAGTQRTIQATAATGTKSNVASSATSVTILASNTNRKGAMVYNDSTQILYLDLSGGTASNSSYSVQVPSQGFFELPGPTIYNGAITGIWASANGNARVTEFS